MLTINDVDGQLFSIRDAQSVASGPFVACEMILSGPQVKNGKNMANKTKNNFRPKKCGNLK